MYGWVRFADPGTGDEVTRCFGTRKDAQAALDDARRHLKNGTYDPGVATVTVAEVAAEWRAASYAPRKTAKVHSTTAAAHDLELHRILQRWGPARMNALRVSDIEKWRNEMLQDSGASTARNVLLVLGIRFRFAMRGARSAGGLQPGRAGPQAAVGSRKM